MANAVKLKINGTTQAQVSDVVILGASISDGVVLGKSSLMEAQFRLHDISVEVHDESARGRNLAGINAHWNTVKGGYSHLGDAVLCVSHCMGNDISTLHPYSATSSFNVELMKAELNTLTASVTDNSNLSLLVEATFRGYNSSRGDDYTWHNEENGSLPFNSNIGNPAAELLQPPQYDADNQKPFVQCYNWSFNYGKILLEYSEDRIHFGEEGSELLRRLWVDNIAAFIKGENPIVVDKLTLSEALAVERTVQEVIFGEASTNDTGVHNSMPLANYLNISSPTTATPLLPISGYEPCAIKLTSAGDILAHSSNTAYDDNGDEPTLENWRLQRAFGYMSNTEFQDFFVVSGLESNQLVDIGMAAYRGNTSNNWSQFRMNGNDAALINVNGHVSAGENVAWAGAQADENGEIRVEMRKSGGAYGYWNGCHIKPK